MIDQKNNSALEINQHLAVVFNEILPALTRAGVKYWVFGGVGVAGVAGRFVRENQDVDVYVLDEDFNKVESLLKSLCATHGDWDGDGWKLLYSVLKSTKRWKLDLYIRSIERFSVLPIYRVEGGLELRITEAWKLSNQALIQELKTINGFQFFSPPQDIIIELFRFLTERYINHHDKGSFNNDSKHMVDARVVFNEEELNKFIIRYQESVGGAVLLAEPKAGRRPWPKFRLFQRRKH